ncbi:MAG TPA: phasin family protein [Casimicrobiaceae bacterium]
MIKQAAGNISVNRVADVALAASRQVWLAGLGAAVVTRGWARNDAGHMFRALVKEGSTVESRTLRVLGRRIESSIALATTTWNRARDTARTTVGGLVETAAAALPAFKVPAAKRISKMPKKSRSTKAHVSRKGLRAKRTA